MPNDKPRLIFKKLRGFQTLDEDEKIKTILFLDAAREIVSLIGKFNKNLKFFNWQSLLL